MKLPNIDEQVHGEILRPDDIVWYISGRKVFRTSLVYVELILASRGDNKLTIQPVGYCIVAVDDSGIYMGSWPLDHVYKTEDAALADAKWNEVSGISDSEWLKAIGDRDDEESLDACELLRCCANISRARDILYTAKEQGGLIQRDLLELRANFYGCVDPSEDFEEGTPLWRILEQLEPPEGVLERTEA